MKKINKKAFYSISYGLYIVSSKHENEYNGQIANTVFQISSKPPIFAISINKENLTHEYITYSRMFTVSVLSKEAPFNLIGLFGFKSGRDIDKFEKTKYKLSEYNIPIVTENTIAYLECKVINSIDTKTHTVFLGEVLTSDVLEKGEAMTYAFYHTVKKGLSPKKAPTYIEPNKKKERKEMKQYRCKICGYIYDPEKGDPDSGINPGTAFEDIPDDWICPICGAGKDDFEEI